MHGMPLCKELRRGYGPYQSSGVGTLLVLLLANGLMGVPLWVLCISGPLAASSRDQQHLPREEDCRIGDYHLR